MQVDRKKCAACGACADVCPAAARRTVGRRFTVDALLEVLLRDRIFYGVSGGGVTLSGGEPTLFAEFAAELTRRLKQEGIHTALETCGAFAWSAGEPLIEQLDLILFDLKIADPARHQRLLKIDNRSILDNLHRLLTSRRDTTVVRIPVIPGYTSDPDNISALSRVLCPYRPRRIVLLPFHPFGLSKAASIGCPVDSALKDARMSRQELEHLRSLFSYADAVEIG